VTRSELAKVTTVQRRQLWFAKTLGDGEQTGIAQANIGVGILIAYLARPPIVLGRQIFHAVGAGVDVVEQSDQDARVQSLMDPVIDLDEHERGNHQRLSRFLN